MPKYYITNPDEEYTIIEGDDPIDGCIKAIVHRFKYFELTKSEEGSYIVSEIGFDLHDDDYVFSCSFLFPHIPGFDEFL